MKRILLPVAAVAASLAAAQAHGQQRDSFPNPGGQVSVAPVEDVVMAVEQRLRNLGYAVTPDGEFDADLRNSVLLFQSDHGLRPTGNVDLATIAALGIDVDPSGMATAQAVQPQPGDQMAMAPAEEPAAPPRQVAVAEPESGARVTDFDYPLLKDEHMNSPQTAQDFPRTFENYTGVPQSPPSLADEIAAVPPAYVEHEWE